MTFERLNSSKGALSDAELEHLLALVLEDAAILEAARQLSENARAVRTKQNERDYSLSENLWQEIRTLSLSAYSHSSPQDWHELYLHLDRYCAQRWLSDLDR